MQVDPKVFLDLVEKNASLFFWDTETSGREADYNRVYVVSVKPFGKRPVSFTIGENLQDRGVVRDARDYLGEAHCWVTFYGKGFDVPMLNTRLVRWGYEPLRADIPHVDLYYVLSSKLRTGRRSQAHLLEFLEDTMRELGIPAEGKMTLSPNVWADLPTNFHANLRLLRERCESDTVGLESLYRATRHLIRDIRRGN